jgi:hypothetical protein
MNRNQIAGLLLYILFIILAAVFAYLAWRPGSAGAQALVTPTSPPMIYTAGAPTASPTPAPTFYLFPTSVSPTQAAYPAPYPAPAGNAGADDTACKVIEIQTPDGCSLVVGRSFVPFLAGGVR